LQVIGLCVPDDGSNNKDHSVSFHAFAKCLDVRRYFWAGAPSESKPAFFQQWWEDAKKIEVKVLGACLPASCKGMHVCTY
jgi:hypothetical protein